MALRILSFIKTMAFGCMSQSLYAFISALLCVPIRMRYGWIKAFGLCVSQRMYQYRIMYVRLYVYQDNLLYIVQMEFHFGFVFFLSPALTPSHHMSSTAPSQCFRNWLLNRRGHVLKAIENRKCETPSFFL